MSNTNNNAEVRLTTEVITKKYAEVIINGQSKGKREINGTPSLSEFSQGVAREFGIKGFHVTVDDTVVTTQAQANAPVGGSEEAPTKVAIATKETRGGRSKSSAPAEMKAEGGDSASMPATASLSENTNAPADEATVSEPAPASDEQPTSAEPAETVQA